VIAKAGEHPKVVLEATYGWYWAADELAAAGAEVHLAHPLGVKAFTYRRVKNDEKDAADLADLLRMGRLAEAWIAPPEVRELREITRYRIKLVRMRSSGKEQVHAVLAKLGIPVTCSDLSGVWGSAWLDGLDLPQPYAGKVASLRELTGWLSAEVGLLDVVIADLPGSYRPCHAVRALPGLGPVLAAVASPRPPRPASCSPASSTRCATGRSDPWPPAATHTRPGEQARTRAARDRRQAWPPPPGGAAAPVIDPAARRGPPHAPAARNRGNPEGMTAARRLPCHEAAPRGRNTAT